MARRSTPGRVASERGRCPTTPVEVIRYTAVVTMILGVVMFADTPFLTLGQKFLMHRWRERLFLLGMELNFLMLWVMARAFLRWEWPLAPESLELTLAALGLALLLAGGGFALWAKLKLGRWYSATFGVKSGHELITGGPYALVRHPIYTGLLAALLAAALVWNSLLTLVLALAMIVPFYFHTAIEEAMFEEHFGDAYREYLRRVPRLVPFTRPSRAAPGGRSAEPPRA